MSNLLPREASTQAVRVPLADDPVVASDFVLGDREDAIHQLVHHRRAVPLDDDGGGGDGAAHDGGVLPLVVPNDRRGRGCGRVLARLGSGDACADRRRQSIPAARYGFDGRGQVGARGAVRSVAVALAPRGVTVNTISPGWIDDSVLNTLPAPVVQMIRDHHENGWTPMRRLGTPADVGNAVALLCSSEAGWITGQMTAVDGGASLMNPARPLAIQQPEFQPA